VEQTVKQLQLREAKASLSLFVDRALAGEPTTITRHGRREAVLISYEEWRRLSSIPSFGTLLAAFPASDDVPPRAGKPARALLVDD